MISYYLFFFFSFHDPHVVSVIPAYDLKRLYENYGVTASSGMKKLILENKEIIKEKNMKVTYFGIQ